MGSFAAAVRGAARVGIGYPGSILAWGTSDLFVNSYLAFKRSSFGVANLRNSWLLRAIPALNLNILNTIYFAQNRSEVP